MRPTMLSILLTVLLHVQGIFTAPGHEPIFTFCGNRSQQTGGGFLEYESRSDCESITIVHNRNALKIIAPFQARGIVRLQSTAGFYRFCLYWYRSPSVFNVTYGTQNYSCGLMELEAAPCRAKPCSAPELESLGCNNSDVLHDVTTDLNNKYLSNCAFYYDLNVGGTCDVKAVENEVKTIEQLIRRDGPPIDSRTALVSLRRVEAALTAVNFSGQTTTFGDGRVRASVFKLNASSYRGLVLDSKSLLGKSAASGKGSFSVSLPQDLLKNVSGGDQKRLLVVSFDSPALFKNDSDLLNDQIIGISVEDTTVENLQVPVNLTFRHHRSQKCRVPLCVFWDSASDNSTGIWNTSGCRTVASDKQTECRCDHLTYFAVLMQISSTEIDLHHQRSLTLITYAGCGLSAVASLFTVACYLFTGRTRTKAKDRTIPIHMHLLSAIFLLNLSFIVSVPLSSVCSEAACQAGALFLHASLLCCFAWMAIEGYNLYKKVVEVFDDSRKMLRLSCLGWGVPVISVLIIFSVDPEIYGTYTIKLTQEDYSATMCWITNSTVHYVVNLGSFGLIFLFNTLMLCAMMREILKLKSKKMQQKLQYAGTLAGLSCTLGFTWGLAFFSFGAVSLQMMYVFTILNSLQGCFIFLWYWLMRRQAQRSESSQMTTDSIRPHSSIPLTEE